ncbi:MAG: hypothetical protein ABR508_10020, partial [Candidatus Baltobacteraceae bacterium]
MISLLFSTPSARLDAYGVGREGVISAGMMLEQKSAEVRSGPRNRKAFIARPAFALATDRDSRSRA